MAALGSAAGTTTAAKLAIATTKIIPPSQVCLVVSRVSYCYWRGSELPFLWSWAANRLCPRSLLAMLVLRLVQEWAKWSLRYATYQL